MFDGCYTGHWTAWGIALLLSLVCAYACGSIPFAIVIGKHFYGVDVRECGSGNTGATNVLRVLGAKAGIACLLLDVLKGFLAVVFARLIFLLANTVVCADGISALNSGWPYELAIALSAAFAVLGHCISPWLSFKGGKGVASSLGVLIALMPKLVPALLLVFIAVLGIFRYASLASISSALALPVLILIFYPGSPIFLVLGIFLSTLLIIAHRGNISRLAKGEERRFSIGDAKRKEQR